MIQEIEFYSQFFSSIGDSEKKPYTEIRYNEEYLH
jgi:hypothetical protein